jgi:ABC-type nitrate/sulfonate/bicarbonate transport system ATPase subunit
VNRRIAADSVRTAAARFGLADVLDRRPWQLSGGMRQRVALLRATLPQTGVLLLDEPFGALDAITRSSLQQWLAGVMRQSDQAVVLVTHDVEEALLLADRVHVMAGNPGRIVDTIAVDLPKPRSSADTTSPRFTALKARLLSTLDAGEATP